MKVKPNMMLASLLTIGLSLTSLACSSQKSKPDVDVVAAAPEVLVTDDQLANSCDKALNLCDVTLHKKNEELKKQTELVKDQSKELATVKSKADNPLNNPIVWAAVGTGAVLIGGPIAAPIVILAAVILGVFLK